jgi:hypothetical protein
LNSEARRLSGDRVRSAINGGNVDIQLVKIRGV